MPLWWEGMQKVNNMGVMQPGVLFYSPWGLNKGCSPLQGENSCGHSSEFKLASTVTDKKRTLVYCWMRLVISTNTKNMKQRRLMLSALQHWLRTLGAWCWRVMPGGMINSQLTLNLSEMCCCSWICINLKDLMGFLSGYWKSWCHCGTFLHFWTPERSQLTRWQILSFQEN